MPQDFQTEKKISNIEKDIVLSHSYISKRTDGIIEIYYTGITYDIHHFEEIDANLKQLFTTEKLLILNYTSPKTSSTSKAKNYLAQPARAEFIKAGVIIVHSLAQKLLVHFYLHINKPKVITTYFDIEQKAQAEDWLLSFKSEQNHF